MTDDVIERTIQELRDEAEIDFVSLPLIAESVREELDLQSQEEIRRHALDVVQRLTALGVYPGDYDHAVTMSFWSGTEHELVKRIEAEWIAMGTTPTLEHPICWFGLKASKPA